jgi:FtsP/CotA-like multicopper oxidase with cupredoxin domain
LARQKVCAGLIALLAVGVAAGHTQAQGPAQERLQAPMADACPRPAPGSTVSEPEDIRSKDGVLTVELAYRESHEADGETRYCYMAADGTQAPTLRPSPGDWVVVRLKNDLTAPAQGAAMAMEADGVSDRNKCAGAGMSPLSTNLHFHGLTIPPTCHEDDVLHTWIQPGAPAFEYRFQIPQDQPPGLYWYHPHVHGYTNAQVQGGASGALIIEGIERANPELAGLPERVLILRDQGLIHPNAQPAATGESAPPVVLDRDGDILNTGTGTGKPAKDLSVNFVPVPYPDYPPAVIETSPAERQLWRVLNASAITYLNLQVLFKGVPQMLGVVGLDGEPIIESGLNGKGILWQNHLGLAPGARIEFIVTTPEAGVPASLITRSVNTGPAGENDPTRTLAAIVASSAAPELPARLAATSRPLNSRKRTWLGNVTPVRTRKLYFTEEPRDANDPKSPTVFMLTVEGQAPKPFDMHASEPNIVVHQGDVEDWIIENRTQEVHAFHIHQLHFLLLDWYGLPVNEPFLRDVVNVPFWDGKASVYPSVKLRVDFRNPEIVGTFVYHCHLLEHEDGGMMGTIRVEPAQGARTSSRHISGSQDLAGQSSNRTRPSGPGR